jgi:hypothetical protein
MIELNGKLYYEFDDIKIGEIYKSGKENFLVVKKGSYQHKVRNFTKAQKEEHGGEYRICVNNEGVFCKKTTDLNGSTYVFSPSKFTVTLTSDKFNKILYLSEELMSEMIDSVNTKNSDLELSFELIFDDNIILDISFHNNALHLSLISNDGNILKEKIIKKFDFNKKLSLKFKNKTFSFMFLSEEEK